MDCVRTVIKRRVTCRNFTDEALSRETLAGLIRDAVWVPSGSNNQPWRFVVCTDRAQMQSWSDAAKQSWLENLADCPHMQQYEEFIRDPAYNIFYNAPALVIVYGSRQSYWRVYDCSMVAYNLHLLAEQDGLGCCWIGFAHNLFADPRIMRELQVPEDYELVAPVILGHPAAGSRVAQNPNPRKPFDITFL